MANQVKRFLNTSTDALIFVQDVEKWVPERFALDVIGEKVNETVEDPHLLYTRLDLAGLAGRKERREALRFIADEIQTICKKAPRRFPWFEVERSFDRTGALRLTYQRDIEQWRRNDIEDRIEQHLKLDKLDLTRYQERVRGDLYRDRMATGESRTALTAELCRVKRALEGTTEHAKECGCLDSPELLHRLNNQRLVTDHGDYIFHTLVAYDSSRFAVEVVSLEKGGEGAGKQLFYKIYPMAAVTKAMWDAGRLINKIRRGEVK